MSVLRQRDAGFFHNQGFQPLVEGLAFTFSGGETGAVRDGADARANVAAGWFIRRLAHFSAGFQIIINQVAGIAAKTPQAKAGTIFAHQFCRQCRQNLLAVTCALPAQHFGADALPHAPVEHGERSVGCARRTLARGVNQGAQVGQQRVRLCMGDAVCMSAMSFPSQLRASYPLHMYTIAGDLCQR